MYTIITRNPNNPNTYGQIYTVNIWAGTDPDRVVVTGPDGKIDPSLHLTTTLNGINSVQYPVQLLATGSVGTAPNWVSTADTHTLNIPMAQTPGVTAGLWSNVNYNRVGFKDLAQTWDLTQTFTLAPVISNVGTGTSNASTYGQLLTATTDAAIMSKLLAGYVLGTNQSQLLPSDSILSSFQKTQLQLNNKEPLNTGLLSGGALSINIDNTKFDIGTTILYFADFSNPAVPTGTYQVFNAQSGIPVTNIATQNATYVGINNLGAVIQQGTPFTSAQSRTIVSIGAVVHSNRVNINVVNNIGASSIDPNLQTHDLMNAIGPLNTDGNIYSANSGSNLFIDKSQGTLFKFGANFQINHNDPHTISVPQQSIITFRYRLQNSFEYSNTTSIDPNNYDVGGVLTPVPFNKFTVQRISLFQSGITRIQYGQALYNSLAEAVASYHGEPFITEQNIKDNSVLRGYLIIGQGTTSLLDITKVRFFDVSKFGNSPSYHIPSEHIDLNDIDVTLSGIRDKVVTVTNILSIRNLYLPSATIPNQQIQVVDESGKISPTSYLHIICSGSDMIETEPYFNLTGPYDYLTLVSNGSGRWDVLAKEALLSAGIQSAPSYVDNGDGTVTVGTGFFNLYRNPTGLGSISAFSITGTTYTPVDGVTNYVIADYNSGNPILRITQDVSVINETTIIPVLTVYRGGTFLHILEWDNLGLALSNKLHQSIVKTQRYRRESGLGLGETGIRNVTVAGGTVWTGAVRTVLGNFNSTIDNIYFNYHVGGVWNTTLVHQYNNLYYDNGTDLVSVNPNRYVINYVYIGVESRSEAYITLGGGNYGTLAEAVNSQPGPVPPLISSHAILVGRIIVLQGADVATQIDSAFVTPFTNTLGGNHNDLAGLQGGVATEYYHLTSNQYTLATRNATSTLTGLLSSTDWNTFNNKQAALNGTGFVKVSGTTVSYDNTTYAPYNQTMYIGTTATPINRTSSEQALTGISSIDGNAATATILQTARTIAISGDVTGTATSFNGSANISISSTISDATVTGKLLTGYAVGTNTALAATDSILGAFNKIQAQINAKGSGTVTSVSTAAANNGVTATWATNTTTPALTIGLGAITPTSVSTGLGQFTGQLVSQGVSTTATLRNVADFSVSSNTATGTIKITLPVSWTNTMLNLRIIGYSYNTIGSWSLDLGGYNYSTTPAWMTVTARGSDVLPFTSVRFGHDGTNCCILLGITSTVWNYPKIIVKDVLLGHMFTLSQWTSGWTITQITDETGITVSATPTLLSNITTGDISSTATDIKMNGTQSAGSLAKLAKADHIHPTDTSRVPITGASYIQSTGLSTSWGTTSGTSTGGFNAIMGTSTSATWLLSGTSGGVFRAGIQVLDGGGTIRFYEGANFFSFNNNTITATTFSGNATTATTATNLSGGTVSATTGSFSSSLAAPIIGVSNTSNSSGYGISLYNGAVAGQPTYGLMFAGTPTFGTHGGVTADWATYFTMNNTANRGWIFRQMTTGVNVASISNTGIAVFSNRVVSGGTSYSPATGTTVTLDCTLGNTFIINLPTAGTAVTFGTPSSPATYQTINVIINQGTTPTTITWPANTVMKWASGTKNVSATASAISVISMVYNGSYWLVTSAKDFA